MKEIMRICPKIIDEGISAKPSTGTLVQTQRVCPALGQSPSLVPVASLCEAKQRGHRARSGLRTSGFRLSRNPLWNFRISFILFFFFIGIVPSLSAEEKENWKEYRSMHFLIYYNQAPEDFIKNVEIAAEQEYETIAQNLGFTRYEGWSWDRRAQVYIYDDQEHYVAARNISWSHGMASVKEKVIRTFPTAAGFFDSTLPHELGHIIFREFVGYKSKIPLWMDEGIAMYQEKAKRWGANKVVARALSEGKFIPLKELSFLELNDNSDQTTVELFYAEAASIIYYMITELGDYRFVNFCRQLKEGCRIDDAIHRAYARFQDLNDLNDAWVKYLSP